MTELKAWQHGYDLTYLTEIQERFKAFNTRSLSPFSEMNKPRIAQCLTDRTMTVFPWGVVDVRSVSQFSNITCYQDLVIARKEPDDVVINAFCYEDRNKLIDFLKVGMDPTYLWIWQESRDERDIAERAGYKFIASKISSFAEIRGLWFKDRDGLFPRRHPQLDPTEYTGIARANVYIDGFAFQRALGEVTFLRNEYTDHYSNYNAKHSWSAVSLRGYTPDPAFITKPAEMNKKWWAQHSGETFELQDTELRAQLPNVDALCKPLTDLAPAHRIRLMKLAAGGGELRRHTDQVDKASGIADGKVARFHIPIETNDQCEFQSWDLFGQRSHVNMRPGECWYLDTRKPHTAINKGVTDRIHLVVDVEANWKIRKLLDEPAH